DAAREAHPNLKVSDAEFLAHSGRHLGPQSDAERALSQLAAADLYLACACARGSPPALAAFDRLLAPVVRRAALKIRRDEAFASLTAQQRNVLRLHHVEGLALSDIAPMYRTHKSTLSRWLADARAELLKRTRDDLRQRLGVPRLELDSLMRAVKSQIDLSIV